MSATAQRRANPPLWPAVAPVVPALVLALAVLGVLFNAEITAATHVWNTSTAYGHCWLVLPIVAFLVHERRYQAGAIRSEPAFWPALLALPLVLAWIVADTLGIMEGRQLALIGFVELALLAALGPRQWWSLAAAFLYLIFLVPFGAFLTGPLQDFTAAFVAHGLDALDIPNRVTQFQIEIPEGNFYVAEACAGLRFLIASIAFGVLYAATMFVSPWRRAAFIAVSCIVPVIANGLRGLGIVVLGHALGSAQAAATDHVLYGFIFFAIVIALLALAGMPFRQDTLPVRVAPAIQPPETRRRAMTAVLPVLALAAAGPAMSAALGSHGRAPPDAPALLIAGPACTLSHAEAQGAILLQTFRCGVSSLAARTEMLPRGANPARVSRANAAWLAVRIAGANTDNRKLPVGGSTPMTWHLLVDEDTPRAAASLLFVDGKPALGGLHDRLRLASDMLHGGTIAPVSIAVAITGGQADPVEVLRSFLAGQGDLAARVAAAGR